MWSQNPRGDTGSIFEADREARDEIRSCRLHELHENTARQTIGH